MLLCSIYFKLQPVLNEVVHMKLNIQKITIIQACYKFHHNSYQDQIWSNCYSFRMHTDQHSKRSETQSIW